MTNHELQEKKQKKMKEDVISDNINAMQDDLQQWDKYRFAK